MTNEERLNLRFKLLQHGVRQWQIAVKYPMDEGELSRILNGRRTPPAGFRERFEECLNEARSQTAGAA
jgi:hypothetical protein